MLGPDSTRQKKSLGSWWGHSTISGNESPELAPKDTQTANRKEEF